MRHWIFALFAALMIVAWPRVAHAAPNTRPAGSAVVHHMLQIINHDRHEAGLPSLHLAPQLSRVASAHSADMAVHRYFAHLSRGGGSPYDRMRAAGIHYRVAGENLAWHTGSISLDLMRWTERAMLASPEHRANLLRPSFTTVGIGIVTAGGRTYLTEDFTG